MSELLVKRRKFYDFNLEITIEEDLRFTVYSFNVVKQDDGSFERYGHTFRVQSIECAFLIFETLIDQIADGSYEPPTKSDAVKFIANEEVYCPTLFGVQAGFTYSQSSH
jgi:hypothetical protein